MSVAISDKRLQQLAQKALYTRSLYDFHVAAWHLVDPAPFVEGRHLRVLAEHLEAVSRGQIRRLLVNVPFRTSKSSMIAVTWPAWDWIHNPSRQWFTLSHTDALAIRDNRKMRVVVQSEWYQQFWPMTFASDQDQKKNFLNDDMGRRQCVGLDCGVTGEGGDIILIDDPADRDAAESDARRTELNLSFDEKIYSRLNDQKTGAFVVIGQRLHEQDLFGHLLKRGGWEHLCLPMRYESDHPTPSKTSLNFRDWRTKDGELLWPERMPEEVVADLEATLGSYGWSSQGQQRPKRRDGEYFKAEWFKVVQNLPAGIEDAVRYWDQANSENAGGDESAGVGMAKKGNDYFIWDIRSGLWNATRRISEQRATAEADQLMPVRVKMWEEKEPGSTGKEAAENHRIEFADFGLRTEAATGPKEARIAMLIPPAQNGNFYLVAGAWNKKFVDQMSDYPRGSRDDMADAAAGAYAKLALRKKLLYAKRSTSDKKEDKADGNRDGEGV